jgi:hypothetical protein
MAYGKRKLRAICGSELSGHSTERENRGAPENATTPHAAKQAAREMDSAMANAACGREKRSTFQRMAP